MTDAQNNGWPDGARWQPIATAPNDGCSILVIGGLHEVPAIVPTDGDWWRMRAAESSNGVPTHWMPLPPAPDAQTALTAARPSSGANPTQPVSGDSARPDHGGTLGAAGQVGNACGPECGCRSDRDTHPATATPAPSTPPDVVEADEPPSTRVEWEVLRVWRDYLANGDAQSVSSVLNAMLATYDASALTAARQSSGVEQVQTPAEAKAWAKVAIAQVTQIPHDPSVEWDHEKREWRFKDDPDTAREGQPMAWLIVWEDGSTQADTSKYRLETLSTLSGSQVQPLYLHPPTQPASADRERRLWTLVDEWEQSDVEASAARNVARAFARELRTALGDAS